MGKVVSSRYARMFGPLLDALRDAGGEGNPRELSRKVADLVVTDSAERNRLNATGTNAAENEVAVVTCPASTIINAITFTSYGTPTGSCGSFQYSSCDAANSKRVVSLQCLGQQTCSVSAVNTNFGSDPCVGTAKRLYIQVSCIGKAFHEPAYPA